MKFTTKDFAFNSENLNEQEKSFVEGIMQSVCDMVNKAYEGAVDNETFAQELKSLNEKLANNEGVAELKSEITNISAEVKNVAESIAKMKSRGMQTEDVNAFMEKMDEIYNSEKFNQFVSGHTHTSGEFTDINLKGVVSLTSSNTGTATLTQDSGVVNEEVRPRRVHLRDAMRVLQGDARFPVYDYVQIYDYDKEASAVAENGALPEETFKIKEVSATTKRIGAHLNVSKRLLKSRIFLQSWLVNTLPHNVWMAEDNQLLFGDGAGNNVLGIANTEGVADLASEINTGILEVGSTTIASIASYNSGAQTAFTFASAQPKVLDGYKLHITTATDGESTPADIDALKGKAFEIQRLNDKTFVIDVAYADVDDLDVTTLTGAVKNSAWKSIALPNSGDVIMTAFAMLQFGNYNPTAIVLNPIKVNAIRAEKDTTGRNLGLVEVNNGIKYINGYPIIESTAIAPNKFLAGDFAEGAHLVDYTSLSVEFADDVDYKLKNQVAVIAEEEVILAVVCPQAFAYGDFASLKTAITLS